MLLAILDFKLGFSLVILLMNIAYQKKDATKPSLR